jgi:preprotein translocase subunit SecE
MLDKVKLTVAALLAAGGIAAFYYWSQQPPVVRVLFVLGGFIAGAGLGLFTATGQTFKAFALSAWAEAKKVVWPSRKETLQTTLLVFAFAVVMALYLWLADKGLEWLLYDLFLGWRK